MFLRTVFESTENTIFVLSENCSCSLNLMFSMVFVFYIKKKKKLGIKRVLTVFLVLIVFENKKQFSKTVNKQAISIYFSFIFFLVSLWIKLHI